MIYFQLSLLHLTNFHHYLQKFLALWQIQQCLDLNLPYLSLGYYIQESEKMSYKIKYQPMEGLVDDHWQLLPGS